MKDLIRKFGNVTIDVREISCIGEQIPTCGPAVGVHLYLKQGEKVAVMFDNEEIAKKETDWLILIWKQAAK